jgi:hypothetical protein
MNIHHLTKEEIIVKTYKDFDKDQLFDLYVTKRLSTVKIAEMFGVKHSKISSALKYCGIATRGIPSKKIAAHLAIDKDKLIELYITQNNSLEFVSKFFNVCIGTIGKALNYHGITKSKEAHFELIRQCHLRKYGAKTPFESPDIQLKVQQANLEKYGSVSPFGSVEIQAKKKKTNLAKYGHECALKNAEVKAKRDKTNLQKYSAKTPFESAEIQLKIQQTNLEKYGSKSSASNPEIQKRIKATNRQRYGFDSHLANPNIRQKIKQSVLKSTGYENTLSSPEIRAKVKETILDKFGVEYYAQKNRSGKQIEITSTRQALRNYLKEVTKSRGRKLTVSELVPLLGYSEPSTLSRLLAKWDLYSYVVQFRSQPEVDLCDLFPTNRCSVRHVINKFELDLYYPEHKLAIEFNGLFWHSDHKKKINYHREKYLACQLAGIRLIQIFEDEWTFTKDIVIDKLNHIFGTSSHKQIIGARRCIFAEVKHSIAKAFMQRNHIQGYSAGRHIALLFDDCPVAIMTLNHPQLSRSSNITKVGLEISRFATDISRSIPGAFTRLLKHAQTLTNRLYSYADLRWVDPSNNIYLNHGFTLYNEVKPAYWYWTTRKYDGFETGKRYYRFQFTKKKIQEQFANFLPAESTAWTEQKMMEYLGWQRIYDAGKLSYEILSR